MSHHVYPPARKTEREEEEEEEEEAEEGDGEGWSVNTTQTVIHSHSETCGGGLISQECKSAFIQQKHTELLLGCH